MPDTTHAQVKTPKWALILGASSGFGEGAARALAQAGYDIVGVHLDRKAGLEHVAEIRRDIEKLGRKTTCSAGMPAVFTPLATSSPDLSAFWMNGGSVTRRSACGLDCSFSTRETTSPDPALDEVDRDAGVLG